MKRPSDEITLKSSEVISRIYFSNYMKVCTQISLRNNHQPVF
jgi:hypothetical protein